MREKERKFPYFYKLLIALAVFAFVFIYAMVSGAAETTFSDVWKALFTDESGGKLSILREIRFPRELAAIFVGAGLSAAGAIMQGMTRNPLADPGLLGLTAGANAALALTLAFIPGANYFVIMGACFAGAAAGAMMVMAIGASQKGGFSPFRIVLAGAAVSAFLFAIAEGLSIYFKLSKDVSMWTAGGMAGTTWTQLQLVIPSITVGILIAILLSKQLTILSLSEEVAVGLGQRTGQIKAILFIVIIILTGAAVALAGNMAFAGLMVPHIVRWIVGTDYRYILPMSAIGGAAFMLLADTAARLINAPYETPVAAVISILGLPFFLYIVHKGGRAFT
ncbi:FecCD family ABC transporter permease [Metabacillus sp. 84]|uniref:FecCD family ABC transporter permease n=1 Tax=Metabacillus sp. 84 TaxID=3404705 RepID=UPI003CE83DCA